MEHDPFATPADELPPAPVAAETSRALQGLRRGKRWATSRGRAQEQVSLTLRLNTELAARLKAAVAELAESLPAINLRMVVEAALAVKVAELEELVVALREKVEQDKATAFEKSSKKVWRALERLQAKQGE